MAKVLIPTPLRQYAGNKDAVELNGATVGEVLTTLTSYGSVPTDRQAQIFAESGTDNI